jgi:hypothetical protein
MLTTFSEESVARNVTFNRVQDMRSKHGSLTRIQMDLAAARWERMQSANGVAISSENRLPQVPALFKARMD